MELTNEQIEKFVSRLKNMVVDSENHTVYPTVNTNIEGVGRRPHVVLWYLTTGRWPGRLRKTCPVDRCILHYEEVSKIKEPLTDTSWGSGRAYAERYGVSPSYVSQRRAKG